MEKEKIIVELVDESTVSIPVKEYAMLVDHDTRLSIIRENVKQQIDNESPYISISSDYILSILDLLIYQKAARKAERDRLCDVKKEPVTEANDE